MIEEALDLARQALWQYASDLRYPPTPDSAERRDQMIRDTLAKVEAARISAGGLKL